METMSECPGELGAKEDTVGYLLYLDLLLIFSFSSITFDILITICLGMSFFGFFLFELSRLGGLSSLFPSPG